MSICKPFKDNVDASHGTKGYQWVIPVLHFSCYLYIPRYKSAKGVLGVTIILVL